MSSITIPVKANDHPNLRPLNVLRDLSAVADLIELCFSPTMDTDGQRYLSDMRRASHDDSFLRWASHMSETASLPLMGYVWEQDGRIIGNASLISNYSLFMPGNSITSALANEFGEATPGLYTSALVELGLILFVITVAIQLIAQLWLRRVRLSIGGDR